MPLRYEGNKHQRRELCLWLVPISCASLQGRKDMAWYIVQVTEQYHERGFGLPQSGATLTSSLASMCLNHTVGHVQLPSPLQLSLPLSSYCLCTFQSHSSCPLSIQHDVLSPLVEEWYYASCLRVCDRQQNQDTCLCTARNIPRTIRGECFRASQVSEQGEGKRAEKEMEKRKKERKCTKGYVRTSIFPENIAQSLQ